MLDGPLVVVLGPGGPVVALVVVLVVRTNRAGNPTPPPGEARQTEVVLLRARPGRLGKDAGHARRTTGWTTCS